MADKFFEIRFRVSADERKKIRDMASHAGLTLASFTRMRALLGTDR